MAALQGSQDGRATRQPGWPRYKAVKMGAPQGSVTVGFDVEQTSQSGAGKDDGDAADRPKPLSQARA
jgi:hypothetical protein